MSDLFVGADAQPENYNASEIEVLEGLEPVRRRPGMYIGGTDERALHHLANEVIDNAMDEAVAGHATRISMHLSADGSLSVSDNGRGIPVDEHPRYPGKSALEVIFMMLHSGGKFSGKAYETSGGLHGVGVSVVNALSEMLEVEVTRNKTVYRATFSRGDVVDALAEVGTATNRRGTRITFRPDAEIFGRKARLKAPRLFRLARSKAYLFGGVEIRWTCDEPLADADVPTEATFKFPGGLADHLKELVDDRECATSDAFTGSAEFPDGQGRVEWAVAWPLYGEGSSSYYCNTIPTPDGGTHENGLRGALTKGMRAFAELTGTKKGAQLTADDMVNGAEIMLSVFVREPQFQSQTKDRLTSPEAARLVEAAVRDNFDHFLSDDMNRGRSLMGFALDRLDERLKRKAEKEVKRKTATNKKGLRLPGKLTDCSAGGAGDTELFIVEGDSAGGSAKQARDRKTQAILPIRGKILNVASSTTAKIAANSEIADLILAIGAGAGATYDDDAVRYDRIVIMTDADVDGAHIATLLMTFFFQEMPGLVKGGRLYLAQPPLYRIAQGGKVAYARDDAHREELMRVEFTGKGKIDTSRFKGLGEMSPGQLKETTMDPQKRTLIRVTLPSEYQAGAPVRELVDRLMGKDPAHRFQFIQDNARELDEAAIDA
ncbi:DNA topoisomerase IV subunit B [Pacificimonas sp. WHA3]|uniref:DNA topoisomerase 4 subunit B n=1 Tax=Pacificimonas pallii TaxID=2827236 RepID=A0ABS6SEK2_9SPHN|nr:DNA topoisomerase IV subunit B [Pacificimonas pallii]MBV7256791.1 DNA topoisomerase IV subunit B [Pacificimonas pallii]